MRLCDCYRCRRDRENARESMIASTCAGILAVFLMIALGIALTAVRSHGAVLSPTLLAILEAERAQCNDSPAPASRFGGPTRPALTPDLAPPQPPRPASIPIIVASPQRASPLNSAPAGGRWVRVQRCYGGQCLLEWQWRPN